MFNVIHTHTHTHTHTHLKPCVSQDRQVCSTSLDQSGSIFAECDCVFNRQPTPIFNWYV